MSDAQTAETPAGPTGVRAWLLAARPKTLTAAVVPVLVGCATAAALGQLFKPWTAALALVSALFIQIGTNLINDAIDFEKGADTEERIGPQRVTQSGLLTGKQVMAAGFGAFAVAMLLAIPLVVVGGWPIVIIGLISLVCGYAYTGGPAPLAYVGLGDLFVIIFFGLVAVGGTHYLVSGEYDPSSLVGGLQVGLLATTLIAINNLRDRDGDAKVGKRTLAVRLGERLAKVEILATIALPFLVGLWWLDRGEWLATALPLLSLAIGIPLARDVWRTPPSEAYNGFLARAAQLHLAFGVLLAIGLWLPGLWTPRGC